MRGRWLIGKGIHILLLAWAMLLAPVAARAASPAPIHPAVCIARVRPGDTAPAMFAAQRRFDCTTPQHAFGPGDFWLLSSPLFWPGGRAAHVRTGSLWQRAITVYGLYADGRIVALRTTSATTPHHMALGAIIERVLPERPVPLVRLMWRIDGAQNLRGMLVGATLTDIDHAGRDELLFGAIYAAFAGLCVALIVYNLALWVALRHSFQLSYCAMALVLLAYACSSSGALAWACPWLDNNIRLRLNGTMLGFAAAMTIAFAQSFFERRVFGPRLRRAGVAVSLLLVGNGLLFLVAAPIAPKVFDDLFVWSFVALMAAVPFILWRAWRERSSYFWLFAMAWGAPILFGCLRLVNAFGLIGWSFWIDNSTILAMALEALLSSMAIAYRIRLLSRERDEARARELAARLLADIDPLTGLLNRRAFLSRAIGNIGRQQLIILDLDHFKCVNEAIGHDGGDEVLRLVARALRDAVPAAALVSRFGGEEFAITMPEESGFAPEALLRALRTQRMPFDLEVTASIGSCTGRLASEADWKVLYRSADAALFEAKAAGRDRARRGAVPLGYAAAA